MIFRNDAAAAFVLTQSDRMHPRYWHEKPGGANIVNKMTTMRKFLHKVDMHAVNGGYMFIKPCMKYYNYNREASSASSAAAAWV